VSYFLPLRESLDGGGSFVLLLHLENKHSDRSRPELLAHPRRSPVFALFSELPRKAESARRRAALSEDRAGGSVPGC
jgi:hypothetical protein